MLVTFDPHIWSQCTVWIMVDLFLPQFNMLSIYSLFFLLMAVIYFPKNYESS